MMLLTKSIYTDEDFSKEVFEATELSRIRFNKCIFRWADFTSVEVLYSCVFDDCDFTNARLNGASIKGCAFLSCRFRGTSFFAATLEECKMTGSDFLDAECTHATFIGGDFSYTVLRKQSFKKQDLSNIRFRGADLSGCVFNECRLTGCEFDEAVVHETSFYKSDLRHSSLGSINIHEASFRQTKLDLEQCVSIAEQLTEGRYTPDEKEAQ